MGSEMCIRDRIHIFGSKKHPTWFLKSSSAQDQLFQKNTYTTTIESSSSSRFQICIGWCSSVAQIVSCSNINKNKSKERHIACRHQCSSSCGWPFPSLPPILTDFKRTATPKTKQYPYHHCKVSKQYPTFNFAPVCQSRTISHTSSANRAITAPPPLSQPIKVIPSVAALQNHTSLANTLASINANVSS